MKSNVKAGFALEFLSFLHNNKAMMITGAIMMVLGTIVSELLGSMLYKTTHRVTLVPWMPVHIPFMK